MIKKKIIAMICFMLSNNCIQAMEKSDQNFNDEKNKDSVLGEDLINKKAIKKVVLKNGLNQASKKKNKLKEINIDYEGSANLFSSLGEHEARLDHKKNIKQVLRPETNKTKGSMQEICDDYTVRFRKKRRVDSEIAEYNKTRLFESARTTTKSCDDSVSLLMTVMERIKTKKHSLLYSKNSSSYKDLVILYLVALEQNKIECDNNALLLQKAIDFQISPFITFLTEQCEGLQIPANTTQMVLNQLNVKNQLRESLTQDEINFYGSILSAARIIDIDLMKSCISKDKKKNIPFKTMQLVASAIAFYLLQDKILGKEFKTPFNQADLQETNQKMSNQDKMQAFLIAIFIESAHATIKVSKHNDAPSNITLSLYLFFGPYRYETAHAIIDTYLANNASKYAELSTFWLNKQMKIREIEKWPYFSLNNIFPWCFAEPSRQEIIKKGDAN